MGSFKSCVERTSLFFFSSSLARTQQPTQIKLQINAQDRIGKYMGTLIELWNHRSNKCRMYVFFISYLYSNTRRTRIHTQTHTHTTGMQLEPSEIYSSFMTPIEDDLEDS
mgnify:CR=1 FL=1